MTSFLKATFFDAFNNPLHTLEFGGGLALDEDEIRNPDVFDVFGHPFFSQGFQSAT